jgi:hypothetical protein
MNQAQIDLDIQCALALGWVHWANDGDYDGPDDATFFLSTPAGLMVYLPGAEDHDRTVSFSTTWAGAGELLEYAHAQGHWIDLGTNADTLSSERHWCAYLDRLPGPRARTGPEAIARAFVRHKGI